MGSIGSKNIEKYATEHGDIFLSEKLMKNFSATEIKNMVDKVSKFYKEFDINPTEHKLLYTLSSDEKLEDYMATASTGADMVIRLNPKSIVLRKENFNTIYHELGHLLDIEISRIASKSAGSVNSSNFANRVVHDAYKQIKKKFPDMTQEQMIFAISNNAGISNREAISDAVRNHFTGNNNDATEAVITVLKKYVKKYLK